MKNKVTEILDRVNLSGMTKESNPASREVIRVLKSIENKIEHILCKESDEETPIIKEQIDTLKSIKSGIEDLKNGKLEKSGEEKIK